MSSRVQQAALSTDPDSALGKLTPEDVGIFYLPFAFPVLIPAINLVELFVQALVPLQGGETTSAHRHHVTLAQLYSVITSRMTVLFQSRAL